MEENNANNWDGKLYGLPDDTMVTVSLDFIKEKDKELKELKKKYEESRAKNDTLIKLMRHFGNLGRHVHVRYDPLRTYNGKYFTIIIDDPDMRESSPYKTFRIDTDNPIEAFCEYIREIDWK